MQGILSRRTAEPAKPYVHQPYPSVRYHRSGATKLVHSDEEHEALTADPDWDDTPAAFAEPAPESAAPKSKAKKAKADPPAAE